jgi:hypothetical protein
MDAVIVLELLAIGDSQVGVMVKGEREQGDQLMLC